MTTLNFENPPVLEAVFDVSITTKNIDHLRSTNNIFGTDFPKQKELNKFEGKFNFSSESTISSDHKKTLMGFSYSKEDGQALIQRRVNGFSFHKLKQYYGWDKFINDAIKYWKLNSSTFENKISINRVGLRFINLIKTSNKNINQSFIISIDKANQIGDLTKIAYNYSLKLEDEYNATVNLCPTTNDEEYTLDIDIFKSFSPCYLEEEKIMKYFNFMRSKKNLIFAKTLKKSILNQYKPIKTTNK